MLHSQTRNGLAELVGKCHADQEAKKQNIVAVVRPKCGYQCQPTERLYRKANPTGFVLLHMQKDARCQQQQLSLERKRCACLSSCLFPVTRISKYSHNLLLYNFDENVTLKIALKYISRSVPGLSSLTYFVTCFQNGSADAVVCCGAKAGELMTNSLALLSPCLSSGADPSWRKSTNQEFDRLLPLSFLVVVLKPYFLFETTIYSYQ